MPTHLPGVALRQRWFEDYTRGEAFEFGDHEVTEAEIIEFASRYDPQPFHVDPVAARHSSFGTLVASGWMTAAIGMALMVEHFIAPASAMGSPGVDKLVWRYPVQPGDRLRMRVTVLDSRRSVSKPDRGVVRLRQELINQSNQAVLELDGLMLLRSRANTPIAEGPRP